MRTFVPLLSVLMTASAAATPLTLEDAEALALANHPRIGEAAQTALAVGEVTHEVRAAYFPVVTLSATGVEALDRSRIAAGGINNPILFSRLAAGVAVNQLVSDFGRTDRLVRAARLREEAALRSVWTAESEVSLQAALAYYSVLRARALLEVAEETVRARRLRADEVTALAEQKLRAGIDASFAAMALTEAELLRTRADNEVRAGEARLAAALGVPQRPFELAEVPLPPPPSESVEGLVRLALVSRPDLAALRLEQDAATEFARAEAGLTRPTLGLTGVAGRVLEPEDSRDLDPDYRAIGLNLSVPVFNGGLFGARRREAEARARAKAEQVRALEVAVVRDVKVAWLAGRNAHTRLGQTERLLRHAREVQELAEQRYANGLGSMVELGQAQLGLTTAQIEAATARYEYQSQDAILTRQVAGANRPGGRARQGE